MLNNCDVVDGDCVDHDGGFHCTCKDGAFDENGDGTSCVDVDECSDASLHLNCGSNTEERFLNI